MSPAKGVCSVLALEAVVGMGRDPMGMLDPGVLAPRLALGKPQPPSAPAVASGMGRVPV